MEAAECEMDVVGNYCQVNSVVLDSFSCLGDEVADVILHGNDDDAIKTKAIDHANNNNTTVEPMEMDEAAITENVCEEATLDTQCVVQNDTLQEVLITTDTASTEDIQEQPQQVEIVEEREVETEVTTETDETRETAEQEQLEGEREKTIVETTQKVEVDEQLAGIDGAEEDVQIDTVEIVQEGLEASFDLSQENVAKWTVVDDVDEETADTVAEDTEETAELQQEVTSEDVSGMNEDDDEGLEAVEYEAAADVLQLPNDEIEDEGTVEEDDDDEEENETEDETVEAVEEETAETVELPQEQTDEVTLDEVSIEDETEEDECLENVEDEVTSETGERQIVEELIIEDDNDGGIETVELGEEVEEVTIEEVEEHFESNEEDEEMEQEEVDLDGEEVTISDEIEKVEEMELLCGEAMIDDDEESRVVRSTLNCEENDILHHPREETDRITQSASIEKDPISLRTEIPNLYAEQSPPHPSQMVINHQTEENSKSASSIVAINTEDEFSVPFVTAKIKQEVFELGEDRFTTGDHSGQLFAAAVGGGAGTALDGSMAKASAPPKKKRKRKKSDQTRQANGFTQPASNTVILPSTGSNFVSASHPFWEGHSLPFEHGFKREIVQRSVVMTGSKAWKSVDVYYFTPAGRKMRSLREVGEYLEKTNEKTLTVANFSFSRRIISNSPFETSRTAKRRKALTSEDGTKPPAKKPCPNVTVVPDNLRPPMIVPKKPRPQTKISAQFGIPKVIALPKGMNIIEKRTEGELTTEAKRCSNHCPGQQGIIPTLQCTKCLCLFHPQCVGLSASFAGLANFICRECGGSYTPVRNNSSLIRLLSPYNLSINKNSNNINNVAGNNNHPHMRTYSGSPNRVSCKNVVVSPPWNVNTSTQTADSRDAKHFPCGVTIEKIPPGTKPVPSEFPTASPTASISVIPMNRPMIFPRLQTPQQQQQTNIRSIVRPEFVPRGYYPNYLFPNLTNAMMRAVNSAQHRMASEQQRPMMQQQQSGNYRLVTAVNPPFPTGCTVQVFPKPTTEQNVILNTTGGGGITQIRVPMSASEHAYTKTKPNNGHPSSSSPLVSIIRRKKIPSSLSSPNPINCFVSSLNGGFTSLLKIFKYLSLPDLLRASQVCSTWRDVARHCSVWETVVLKNVRIRNWEMFGRSAPTLAIQHLDMRGMPIGDNRDVTFRGILLLSSKIRNLQTLHLCEVPAYIVHTVTTQHPNLKCFTSEWITEGPKDSSQKKCNLDLGKFGKVVNLESLHLRGIYGLYLLGDGLMELGNLNRLTRLCVTSLREVPPYQYTFLKSLPNLKILEIGECLEFNEEVYESIGQLTNLTTLRLEFGGDCAERGVEIVLSSLRNLVRLELIIFRIPPNFGELLEQMRNLRHMTIWPDMQIRPDHNNYNTVRSTKFIPFVKTLMWGLVTSALHDNNQTNFGGGDSQHRIDHNSCCIPFLTFNLVSTAPVRTYISAHQLMNKLRSELPQSKVQVVMVPNSSYRTIAYMPR